MYSASIALYGGTLLPYYLKEGANWGMDLADVKTSIDAARAEGKQVGVGCCVFICRTVVCG